MSPNRRSRSLYPLRVFSLSSTAVLSYFPGILPIKESGCLSYRGAMRMLWSPHSITNAFCRVPVGPTLFDSDSVCNLEQLEMEKEHLGRKAGWKFMVSQLLICCCDKTLQLRQFIGGRDYLGLEFQKPKSSQWWEGTAAETGS